MINIKQTFLPHTQIRTHIHLYGYVRMYSFINFLNLRYLARIQLFCKFMDFLFLTAKTEGKSANKRECARTRAYGRREKREIEPAIEGERK